MFQMIAGLYCLWEKVSEQFPLSDIKRFDTLILVRVTPTKSKSAFVYEKVIKKLKTKTENK